ncbi:MAG: hypothetical protein ACOY71_02360, partial [Gemmatimonadota bacterium]
IAIAELSHRNTPAARTVESSGVGHMANMQVPEHLNEIVLALVADCWGAGQALPEHLPTEVWRVLTRTLRNGRG